jgi:hypothetical protein
MRIASVIMVVVFCSMNGCLDAQGSRTASSAKELGSGEASAQSRPFRRAGNQILTDTFDVLVDRQGDVLVLSLTSDLADDTKLVVSVSRSYQEQGSSEVYPVDYFGEHSTIGAWRQPRRVRLDHGAWEQEIEERQRALAAAGDPFTVSRIADSIEVSFVVPVNQEPPFETWNANLMGSVVKQSGSLRIVEDEITLHDPIEAANVGQARFGSPLGLDVQATYTVSRQTPLMPEIEPADPIAAIDQIRNLDPGAEFTVLEVKTKRNTPWYRVRTGIGEGWINSTAFTWPRSQSCSITATTGEALC